MPRTNDSQEPEANEALRASELRYRRLFETAKDGILILDAQTGAVVDVNPFLIGLLGFSRERFLDKKVWELGFFRDVWANEDKFAEWQQKGYVRYEDLPLKAADGRQVNVEFVSNVYQVNHHKVIQCNIRDISQRKQTEAAVRLSEQQLRSYIDNAGDAIYVIEESTGRIRNCNARACHDLGYSREELLTLSAADIESIIPAGEIGAIHHQIRHGEKRTIDGVHKRKDGSVFPVEIRLSSLAPVQPELLIAMVRDITDRNRAEEALHHSEERFRLLVEQSGIGVGYYDLGGTILFFNHKALLDLGGKAEDYIGKSMRDIFGENQAAEWLKRFQSVVNNPNPQEYEDYVALSTGKKWFLSNYARILNAPGDAIGVQVVSQDITERKLAEETLRQSEARYRSLFENMLNGFAYCRMIFEKDRPQDFVYLGVNAAFEALTGLKDVVGRKVSEVIPGILEADPWLIETYGRVARTGVPESFEIYIEALKMWFAVSVYSPGKDDFVAVFDVITKRRQAEAALKEAGQLNRQIIASVQEGIIVYDLDLRYKVWNQYMESLTGILAQDLLGKRPLEVFPFLREAGVVERLKRALAGDIQGPIEFPFQVPQTGRTGWASDASVPLRGSDGKIIGVLATVRDITEQRKASAALTEETTRRRILFEQSPDGMVILDPVTTRFLEFNTAAHEHLGYSREEFALLSLSDVDVVETINETKSRITGVVGGERADFETVHRTRQGTIRNVLVTAQTIDVAGRPVYFCVWRDITERKEMELKFIQAQKMEAIGQLAGGVAHDFRNQLTVIKGYGEMLLRRSLVKAEGVEKLREILNAADRSATISGQLLSFSRHQMLRSEITNISSLAVDLIKSLAQTLGEDIKLSVIPCGDLWNISVDTGQIQQALLNLVLNARDAMPNGGQLTIETQNIVLDENFVRMHAGSSVGRYIVLTVSDTGTGMIPETLNRLFEPFFTTKPVGEGTGLGLAMVHGFVAQSGGFIEVNSRPDQGTTFRLYFPAVDDVAEDIQRPPQSYDLPRGSGTVLLVEDEESIRRILLETLGECGYTVLTAGNAQETMALIKSADQKINLLITDVVMPGWSGPELVKHFQAARPDVPVLMISGHTGKALTAHGVVPADVNLLVKPFSAHTLAQTVGQVMRQPNLP